MVLEFVDDIYAPNETSLSLQNTFSVFACSTFREPAVSSFGTCRWLVHIAGGSMKLAETNHVRVMRCQGVLTYFCSFSQFHSRRFPSPLYEYLSDTNHPFPWVQLTIPVLVLFRP